MVEKQARCSKNWQKNKRSNKRREGGRNGEWQAAQKKTRPGRKGQCNTGPASGRVVNSRDTSQAQQGSDTCSLQAATKPPGGKPEPAHTPGPRNRDGHANKVLERKRGTGAREGGAANAS